MVVSHDRRLNLHFLSLFSHPWDTLTGCNFAHQAVHGPGFLLALPGTEAPMMAASPAAQRVDTPLMPATHIRAPVQFPPHRQLWHQLCPGELFWKPSCGRAANELTMKKNRYERTLGCSTGQLALQAAASAPAAALKLRLPQLKEQAALLEGHELPPPYQDDRQCKRPTLMPCAAM